MNEDICINKHILPNNKVELFAIFEAFKPNYVIPYSRRDCFRIVLTEPDAKAIITYGQQKFTIDRTCLLLLNPIVPFSAEIEATGEKLAFQICIFSSDFGEQKLFNIITKDSVFFKENPCVFLNFELYSIITGIFELMKKEFNSNSRNGKNDLLYHYLSLVILYANKAQTLENDKSSTNAAVRITTKFINLLENQFPVMSPDISIPLKYPQDFSNLLSIHVNHLNKSTKEVLQKTTSEIISDRLLQEARSLLQNTDWSISEISNSLGFEYPSHFNSFFKKHTKLTPSAIRNTLTKS